MRLLEILHKSFWDERAVSGKERRIFQQKKNYYFYEVQGKTRLTQIKAVEIKNSLDINWV